MDNAKYRKIFSSLPTITTERLILKRILPENAEDMYEYASRQDVTQFLLWSPHVNLRETKGYIEYLQREYRKGNYADWGITLRSSGKFVGTIGFANLDLANNWGELGYVLNPAYHGMGIMTEALGAVLELAFRELSLHRVQLRIMDGNADSEKLARRMGFVYEGLVRDSVFAKGSYRRIHLYSMLAEEYFSAPRG